MRRVALCLLILLAACEHAPPSISTCVTTEVEGERLRVLAAYYDEARLFEIIADVPIEGGQACFTFRPPTDEVQPVTEWTVYIEGRTLGATDSSPGYTAWPIDISVYDDLDGDAVPDPGELRVRRLANEPNSVAWFADFEPFLRYFMAVDPTGNRARAARPFIATTLSPRRGGQTDAVDPVPAETVLSGDPSLCDVALYPSCLGTTDEIHVPGDVWVDPRLTDEQRQAEGLPGDLPFGTAAPLERAAQCSLLGDGVLLAFYVGLTFASDPVACRCRRGVHAVYVYTVVDDPPAWLDCGEDDGSSIVSH